MTKDGISKEVVYIDDSELIFSENNSENPRSELTKQILYRMFEKSGLGLYKACDIAKANHPSFTSAQNIGNKIKRGTVDLMDMIYLAEACGYQISFNQATTTSKIPHDFVISDAAIPFSGEIKAPEPQKREESKKSYKKYVLMGYSAYISNNFGIVTIAGEKADEAAQWLQQNSDNLDEIEETALMIKANEQFDVLCRPVKSR